MQIKVVNSLEKIYPDKEPMLLEGHASALKNDVYHFQLAIYSENSEPTKYNRLSVEGALSEYTEVRIVDYVPVTYIHESDDYYEGRGYGIYPDPLRPISSLGIVLPPQRWVSLWVTVRVPRTLPSGEYRTDFKLLSQSGETLSEAFHEMTVCNAVLPETKLILTNWMHYDAIASRHNVKLFTKEFYRVFESYLRVFTESGYNMLLTPIFTPPLDTEVGEERMTAQLVNVEVTEDGYRFGFERLRRFIRFALRCGVRYIEFSHLFTQWGGAACPKIVAKVDGEEKRIFGWDTPSTDAPYRAFLDAFLPALMAFLRAMGIEKKCFFHLTDEPNEKNLEKYKECRDLVKKHIGTSPIIDALSNYEFYRDGLVEIPFVHTPAYATYAKNGATEVGVYNCCGPAGGYYSNRFINMPAQRLRVLGFQLYKSDVLGYLHWGYNFYNSALSATEIDPFGMTDALGCFPAGDGYIVYPGKDGAWSSVRADVAADGFRDERALRLLEKKIGREAVVKLLSEYGIDGYNEYPHSAEIHTEIRDRVNRMVAKNAKK